MKDTPCTDWRCLPCSTNIARVPLFLGVAALCGVVVSTVQQALRSTAQSEFDAVAETVVVIGMNYAQGTALLAGFNLDWGSSIRAIFAGSTLRVVP